MLVRERFSSISTAVSIRSKPNSRFHTFCFSCISKRRICPRRCVAAQMFLSHFPTSLGNRALRQSFQKSDKKRSGSRSPDTLVSRTISRQIPGSLGFPGCPLLALLRPVPPTLATSLQRSRSVPRPCLLDVEFLHSSGGVFWDGDFPALGRCRHRQISTVTLFQAHPSGLLRWSRGPSSRAAGGFSLTGAILKARSAGGVSGSFGRSVIKPKLLDAGLLFFVPSSALLHKR